MGLSVVRGEAPVEAVRCQYGGCPAVRRGLPGQTVDELREVLREQGWLCVNDVDVCPRCRTRSST